MGFHCSSLHPMLVQSRRSEPRASERCALADEKSVAREIFGRHHSDIDDTMSSESEEEFINGITNTPTSPSKQHYLQYQNCLMLNNQSEVVTQVHHNNQTMKPVSMLHLNKALNKDGTPVLEHNYYKHEAATCTIQKGVNKSFDNPSSKAETTSWEHQSEKVMSKFPPPTKRLVPMKDVETCSSDSPGMGESDLSNWSENSND